MRIIIGDMKVKVGEGSVEQIIGEYQSSSWNVRGYQFSQWCIRHYQIITNTLFKQTNRRTLVNRLIWSDATD